MSLEIKKDYKKGMTLFEEDNDQNLTDAKDQI